MTCSDEMLFRQSAQFAKVLGVLGLIKTFSSAKDARKGHFFSQDQRKCYSASRGNLKDPEPENDLIQELQKVNS